MRYLAVLLLLLIAGTSLPACAQKAHSQKKIVKKTAKKAALTPASTAAGPVLTFERTPCFGTCPGYVMQVYADGRVAYDGRRAVPIMGKKDLRLPPATVADLLRTAQEAHFEQFQDKYSRGATDLPSTVVAVRQPNGQLKTVVVETNAPENVQQLFTYFANQFDALAELKSDR